MTGAALEIAGLTKDFPCGPAGKRLRAVDNISLRVEAGEVFGLMGPNGSGKSTTVKVVLDLIVPTSGECRVFGVSSRCREARGAIGYLPESPRFCPFLTGREVLSYCGALCGLVGGELKARVNEALAAMAMAGAADRRLGTYSKGMRQRIGLAQCLVHHPRLLILDEPTDGLDPVGAAEMRALILELRDRGAAVLIVSHQLTDIERMCSRVALMNRGRIVSTCDVSSAGDCIGSGFVVDSLAPGHCAELRDWLGERGGRMREYTCCSDLERLYLGHIGPAVRGSQALR